MLSQDLMLAFEGTIWLSARLPLTEPFYFLLFMRLPSVPLHMLAVLKLGGTEAALESEASYWALGCLKNFL